MFPWQFLSYDNRSGSLCLPKLSLTMDKNELIKYRRTNGILQREGSLQLPANNSANNLVKLSSTKAYLSLAGLGLIYIFNPETMQKTGEINLTSLGIQDNNPDIGIMIERDGYVFAGLSQMVGGWTSPENYKQADVAVIDTKTDKLVKMISEKTSGFLKPHVRSTPSLYSWMKKAIYTFLVSGTSEWWQVIRPAYFGLRKEKQTLIQHTIGR